VRWASCQRELFAEEQEKEEEETRRKNKQEVNYISLHSTYLCESETQRRGMGEEGLKTFVGKGQKKKKEEKKNKKKIIPK